MTTVTKINIRLRLEAWEVAALALSGVVLVTMSWVLVSDFSVRRILWPSTDDGHLSRAIGKVTVALNKTVRQGRDQPEFIDLAQGDEVYPLDTLMAGPGSALKITLDDRSVLEVGENSMVRLNFDSSLRLSGINREMIVEVVTGTVSALGGEQSRLKIKSENRTFLAPQGKPLELTSDRGKIATSQPANATLVARAQERAQESATAKALAERVRAPDPKRLAEARNEFAKLGGVMKPATPGGGNKPTSLADLYAAQKSGPAAGRPTGGGSLAAANTAAEAKRVELAMNNKVTQEMAAASRPKIQARAELAKAVSIEPADNFSVQTKLAKGAGAEISFPVALSWKAEPDDASFTVRFSQKGLPDQLVPAQASGGRVKLTHSIKRPGDYVWKIEDAGGSVLSVRNLHVNSKFQAIELSDPVLIGRERGSKMWAAQDKWGFLFRWRPVKGVIDYKVRITRNVASEAGGAAAAVPSGVVAEMSTQSSEFVLPFKKEWQAERMFFAVEGVHKHGFQLASNHVPFMFTFLPPKPRTPQDKKVLSRDRLMEGAVSMNWDASSEMRNFTLEISQDPTFRQKLETEKTDDTNFRFFPPESGKYYWHVRGDKDSVSSPFSETYEFTVK